MTPVRTIDDRQALDAMALLLRHHDEWRLDMFDMILPLIEATGRPILNDEPTNEGAPDEA